MVPPWFFAMSMTLFGLLFGSFANVVIWRIPRGESIVSPGSHCPSCGQPIAWYDNVPLVSWLLLGGRCRLCAVRISLRYPAVELASGLLFLTAAVRFGVGTRAVFAALAFWLLLVLSVIDLDHLRLPNPLVALLAAVSLVAAAVAHSTGLAVGPLTYETGDAFLPLTSAAFGALLGAGLSALMAAAYAAVRRRKGLGMGDVKFLGALGLLLGPYVLLALFIGSIIGMIVGLLGGRSVRLSERRIPFGPWLAAGAVITSLAGPAVWDWYLRLVGLS